MISASVMKGLINDKVDHLLLHQFLNAIFFPIFSSLKNVIQKIMKNDRAGGEG